MNYFPYFSSVIGTDVPIYTRNHGCDKGDRGRKQTDLRKNEKRSRQRVHAHVNFCNQKNEKESDRETGEKVWQINLKNYLTYFKK